LTSISKYLYRKVGLAVTLTTALAVISCSAVAQFRIAPPERKTPRAIGVLEVYKNGSRRLIPVTFFYERKYYDATFYHAAPVPFTLYSETVYEVQQFGKPLGTFTVQSASHDQAAWWGNGKFKGLPDPSLMAKKKIEPVVLEDPSKPVLHRRQGSEGDTPSTHPTTASASAGAPEADEDPDRPKLHRKEGSAGDAPATPGKSDDAAQASQPTTQASSQPPSSTEPEESSQQDPNRPKLQRKTDSSASKGPTSTPSAPSQPPSTSQPTSAKSTASVVTVGAVERTPSDDPDHPVLRRGKPVEEQSGRDLPNFKLEEAVSRQVAVSDAGATQEPQPLIYTCPPEELTRLETQARDLALAELHRIGPQRGLVLSQNKPATRNAAAKTKHAAKSDSAEWQPTEEQFVPFDLEYNNYATVVYSARYAPSSAAPDVKPKSWVVTVIAREDEGKLVKLYSAVSDPRELGLYPEIRLVDAVDPDGYGHYGLLFREKKRDGVSWLLGRVTGYELQPIFETAER
jgi:hypothetical protein